MSRLKAYFALPTKIESFGIINVKYIQQFDSIYIDQKLKDDRKCLIYQKYLYTATHRTTYKKCMD